MEKSMYEIDFLAVGDGEDSGDAIALRFVPPDRDGWVHVIIDAGFQGDGQDLVDHYKAHYGTTSVDLVILTHPDADHVGGMGEVMRGLDVKQLWLHQIGAHGGATLPAAEAVNDLIGVAQARGTEVFEVWQGNSALGGALTILGPDKGYYDELVAEQVSGKGVAATVGKALVEAARGLFDRLTTALDLEMPFPEKEVTPRNNSSIITLVTLGDRTLLFTGDAGVPALEKAWDYAESAGLARRPSFVQVPHHGSRRNASSAWLDRLLGQIGEADGGTAFVSVVANSDKHPSGKVLNAYMRRGYDVIPTAGQGKCHHHETPARDGWSAVEPLSPMVEEDDD